MFLAVVIAVVCFISLNEKHAPQISATVPAPQKQAAAPHCSSYFGVCVNDPANDWKVTADGLHDFDLFDQSQGLSLFLAYSKGIRFNATSTGFATVELLGQETEAYKDAKDGLTRVITGSNNASGTLIVLLASPKDISQDQAAEAIDSIVLLSVQKK